MAKALIAAGADVNVADPYGATPLLLAAEWGHVCVCVAILESIMPVGRISVEDAEGIVVRAVRPEGIVVRGVRPGGNVLHTFAMPLLHQLLWQPNPRSMVSCCTSFKDASRTWLSAARTAEEGSSFRALYDNFDAVACVVAALGRIWTPHGNVNAG